MLEKENSFFRQIEFTYMKNEGMKVDWNFLSRLKISKPCDAMVYTFIKKRGFVNNLKISCCGLIMCYIIEVEVRKKLCFNVANSITANSMFERGRWYLWMEMLVVPGFDHRERAAFHSQNRLHWWNIHPRLLLHTHTLLLYYISMHISTQCSSYKSLYTTTRRTFSESKAHAVQFIRKHPTVLAKL